MASKAAGAAGAMDEDTPDEAVVEFSVDGEHPYGVQPRGALWSAMGALQDARAEHAGRHSGKRLRDGSPVRAKGERLAGAKRLELARRTVEARGRGLGPFLGALTDDTILEILACLDGHDLARLACASRAAYVFAHHQDVWRALVLGQHGDRMRFDEDRGCWRRTWLLTVRPTGWSPSDPRHRPLRISGIFSDALYKPWACANLAVPERWLRTCTIPRVDGSSLSVERFAAEFEEPNRPVIITGLASAWPAMRSWSPEALARRFGDRVFVAGGFRMTMRQYIAYASAVRDDQPLYLFDKRSMDTAPELLGDYTVPHIFADGRDCLNALGAHRPARRWLIVGPDRSGSTFHKDPNATCAWNAVAHGRKRWIMYPPDEPPPGVHATEDGAEVAAPMALLEWLLDFYGAACRRRSAKRPRSTGPRTPLEATVGPGEIMFVPRGWWHTAINVGPTVAVTQNYVPPSGAWAAWRFMRDRPDQVSGVPDDVAPLLAGHFEAGMRKGLPAVWEQVEAQQARVEAEAAAAERVHVARRWLDAVHSSTDGQAFAPAGGHAASAPSPFA